MAKAKVKVKVTPKKSGSGGQRPLKVGLQPQMTIRIKTDSNGEQRKKGW